MTLTPSIQKFIQKIQEWQQSLEPKTGVLTIHVDEVVSKIATFYEGIRNIIWWREPHLMRRTAMARILKRSLFLKRSGENIGESFLLEIIHAGYFPNDKLPKSKIQVVQKIIDKYLSIFNNSPVPSKDKLKNQLFSKLVDLMACEIEEVLDPSVYLKNNALIELMETVMKERIVIGKQALSKKIIDESEKEKQIYIAIQRALLRFDTPLITYNLLKRQYPNWLNISIQELEQVTQNIYLILENIRKSLFHPLANKFYKICERYDTPFLLLGDIALKDPVNLEENLSWPAELEKRLKKAYNLRLFTLKSRMGRIAFYSTLSVFLTNVFSLYVIEIPFTKLVIGHLNPIAQIVDVVLPTFLMFILVTTIKLPKEENLKLVINEAKKIVYQEETKQKDIYEVEIYIKPHWFFRMINALLYFICFCITLGAMIYICYLIKFPPLSYLIFVIFLSLIAFTGTAIRRRARELHISEPKDSFFQLFIDPFALPTNYIGKWLSARWEKINILGVAFDYLLEAPYLMFVEFLKNWRYFTKEKKEDIR